MIDKKNTKQRMMIIAALMLLASFLLIIFYIVPSISNLKEKSTMIVSKQQEHDLGVKKVQAIRSATQAIAAAKKQVKLLGVAIPSLQNSEEAVLQISTAARDCSVNVKGIAIGDETASKDNSGGSLSVSVNLNGDYSNIIKFSEAIENNIRPITVLNISIASGETGGPIEAKFDLVFPYLGNNLISNESEVTSE